MDFGEQVYYRKDQRNDKVIVIDQPGYGEDWPHDPVHEERCEWFFWDESWAERFGPYESEKECRDELQRYCIECLGETD